jgi:hypothetical protein
MRKHLMVLAVVLLAVAIAAPAFAAVEFKYGGQFRTRFVAEDNVRDGVDSGDITNLPFAVANGNAVLNPLTGALIATKVPFTTHSGDDNRVFLDTRLRLYFTFLASKNLKVVTKFEVGDGFWGDGGGGGRVGQNRGMNPGGDAVAVEVKNMYVEFNIPNTPSTAIVGLQTLTLLDSWIIDDDLPAAVVVTKFAPFKVTLGYVGTQSGWERRFASSSQMPHTSSAYNVDTWFGALDYASGPFKASLVALFQDGHDSSISIDPAAMFTPFSDFSAGPAQITATQVGTVVAGFGGGLPVTAAQVGQINRFGSFNFLKNVHPKDNFLVDLGFNLTYKTDWLMAYVNFVKNLGSVDGVFRPAIASNAVFDAAQAAGLLLNNESLGSVDYEGWMIDAGVTYYCGPYTLNAGGFYTTGPKFSSDPGNGNTILRNGNGNSTTTGEGSFLGMTSKNVDWFVYPGLTGKYFSEIVGGGILGDDIDVHRGFSTTSPSSAMGSATQLSTLYWRGYHFPTNLWTVTAGASWQVMEKTKLSASYWYFGTAEDVPVAFIGATATAASPFGTTGNGRFKMSSNIGHELNFYLDQGIVDGLTLTLVGAYLIADDAWAPIPFGAVTNNLQTTSIPNKAADAFELGARLQWNF